MKQKLMNFYEFKESEKDEKYLDGKHKCIVCSKVPAYWEIGDARYYCPACEEHARLQEHYEIYIRNGYV